MFDGEFVYIIQEVRNRYNYHVQLHSIIKDEQDPALFQRRLLLTRNNGLKHLNKLNLNLTNDPVYPSLLG